VKSNFSKEDSYFHISLMKEWNYRIMPEHTTMWSVTLCQGTCKSTHLSLECINWNYIPSWNRKAPLRNSVSVSVDDAGGPRRLSTSIRMLPEDTNVCCSKNLHCFKIQHIRRKFRGWEQRQVLYSMLPFQRKFRQVLTSVSGAIQGERRRQINICDLYFM
jgi:hypothetical protein